MASKGYNASNAAWSEEGGGSAISVLWTKRLMDKSINAVFKMMYKLKNGEKLQFLVTKVKLKLLKFKLK